MNSSLIAIMSREPVAPSALGLSIWYLVVATVGLPLNVFIVLSTIVRKSLRVISLNWFVVSIALADLSYLISLALFLCWSLSTDRVVCKISGFGIYYFGMISIITAPFLAGLRYMALCGNNRFSILFSRRGVICVDCGIWLAAALFYSPYLLFDKFGLEMAGTCGITHNGKWYETSYYFACSAILFLAYIATFVFNQKLHTWVKRTSMKLNSLSSKSKLNLSDTRNLLKIFRWFLILPVVAFLPASSLEFLYRIDVKLLNTSLDRVIIAFIALPALINPLVTIKYLKPYRLVMEKVGSKIPLLSPVLHFVFKNDEENRWEKIKSNVTVKVQAVYRLSVPILIKRTNSVSVWNSSVNETLPVTVS